MASDPRLCHDGAHHFLLPAFFNTLSGLRTEGREFALVIRTFGIDAPKVRDALVSARHTHSRLFPLSSPPTPPHTHHARRTKRAGRWLITVFHGWLSY